MKEIYDINIQRMNNGAHFTFVSNILARAEADTAVKGKAADQVKNLKSAVNAEDEALKISQKSLLTDEIVKTDSDRDALYAGYKKQLKASLPCLLQTWHRLQRFFPSTSRTTRLIPPVNLTKRQVFWSTSFPTLKISTLHR